MDSWYRIGKCLRTELIMMIGLYFVDMTKYAVSHSFNQNTFI